MQKLPNSHKLKKYDKLLKVEISRFKIIFKNWNFIHFWRWHNVYIILR